MGIKWTKEKIKIGFEKFRADFGRYPTSIEIDKYHYLPSSRQIQRNFGGLPKLRADLGLKGPKDFTKGEHSSERAKVIAKQARKAELEVYTYLCEMFGKPFVQTNYSVMDDKRTKADFSIKTDDGDCLIDIINPKDKRNLLGCLNNKFRLYKNSVLSQHKIIFVIVNKDISEEEIKKVILNKIIKPNKNQTVIGYEEFKRFCQTKKPLKQRA